MRPAAALLAVVAALLGAGCGALQDPYRDAPADERAHSDQHHDSELPADRRDPGQMATRPAPAGAGPREVAVAYALAHTNWSWRTFATQYERMRKLAGGELARQLADNRPEGDQLEGIQADQQTNTAKLVAVDARRRGDAGADVVVVLRELPGGRGVTDITARHTVYRAALARQRNGWRVSSWTLLP